MNNNLDWQVADFGESLVGTTIADRYRADEIIGKGGLGIVFSGLHLSLNKTVAIKVLNVQDGISIESKKRFQQEARITCQLDHQNVVKVYDFGELANGSSFIIMDLVKGDNLENLIEDKTILGDYKRIVSIFLQVCAGLGHAHQAGVIHRDLTPANIMLTKTKSGEEIVKILDFGLSRAFGDGALNERDQRLTSEGHVVGTCLYMSPEQCNDFNLDARTDIYTLGCVLYEVLTGRVPLMGHSALSTLQMQISQDPLPFAKVTARPIPPRFEAIVFKAMKKEPTQRYQSVEELADDLRKVLEPSSASSDLAPASASSSDPAPASSPNPAPTPAPSSASAPAASSASAPAASSASAPAAVDPATGKPKTETIKMAPLTRDKESVQAPNGVAVPASSIQSRNESTAAASNSTAGASSETRTANSEQPKSSAAKPALIAAALVAIIIVALTIPALQSFTRKSVINADNTSIASSAPSRSTAVEPANTKLAIADPVKADTPAAKDNTAGKWKEYQTQGDKLREDGKFTEAQKKYMLSLKELEDAGKEDSNLVASLKRIADIYYIQGNNAEGQKIDKRAAALSKKLEPALASAAPEESHKAVIDRLASLAQLCHNDGQCDRAELLLKRSIEIAKKVYGPDSKQVNQRLDDLATFYLSLGEDKKADEILKSISPKRK